MTEITKQDNLALRKFGINVPQNQKQEVLKQIRSTPAIRDQFQKLKQSLKTMVDEDAFFSEITSSHDKISEIPQNIKVIQVRDNTYLIRAINPEQIQSLTERAFFNSFSLEIIMLKDIQSEETKKYAQVKEQKKQQKEPVAAKDQNYDPEKSNCICGKIKQKQVAWIQCAAQGKCRGSNWYHLQCSGLVDVNLDELENMNYICMYCKRANDQENSYPDVSKRFKKV